jgi:hypothetical protein
MLKHTFIDFFIRFHFHVFIGLVITATLLLVVGDFFLPTGDAISTK